MGAVALVVLAVIVLPVVFDSEPRPVGQDLVIQIPSQDAGRFKTPLGPAIPEPAASKASGVPDTPDRTDAGRSEGARSEASPAQVPQAAQPEATAEAPRVRAGPPSPSPQAAAEAKRARRILEGDSYAVPLGSYSQSANLKQVLAKAASAGYRTHTEAITNSGARLQKVWAGPFASREDAERAREKLKSLGLTVGAVAREQP
ncbi:MAG: SPOR domain-containing protein [Burkholderiales bacterium]|nr:SPOR domain-containing protein [Burkholderiales bacterium]